MATSLSGKSIGNPDNAFIWYLQSGGNVTNTGAAALTSGFQVALGDGAETPLWIDSAGIGVRSSGGFVSKIASAATATRAVTIADSPGTLYPSTVKRLVASVTSANSASPTALPDFTFTPVNGATYEVEISLIVLSGNTGSGIKLSNTGGAGTFNLYEAGTVFGITAAGGVYFATSCPSSSLKFGVLIKGTFTASSTADVTFSLLSANVSIALVAHIGSFIKYTRIA